MKKEINGKMCEMVEQSDDETSCAGCIASNNDELCKMAGDECTTAKNCTKVWKEVSDEQN